MAGKSTNGFKVYNQDELKKLGLEKIDEILLINFSTREIFTLLGIEYENQMHYNQYNLPNGTQLVEKTDLQTVAPNFTLTKDNYGLTAKINVTNIVYDEKINGSDIYYGEVTDSTTTPVTVDYWRKVEGTSFNVTKAAEYAVKVVDKNGGETIKTTKVATCNSPEVVTGMVPVIYDETSKKWKMVGDNNLGQWFDYAEKKWANVMLSDGIVVDEDGTITTMGSMFVWIPRYAYCITSGYQQGGANVRGNIEIKFLKENTNLTTDEKTTRFSDVAGQGNWIVHPVFTDGSKNNYKEGGWDRELNGFWVAKFEASGLTNGNTGTAVGNASASSATPVAPTENTIVKVLPNVISWRHITIGDSQYRCMQMSKNTNYGWTENSVDTHLIKNDEWGAVAYLCYSNYGVVPSKNASGNTSTRNHDLYTGAGPKTSTSTGNYLYDANHAYNTELGVLASTTGNEYGVYDMSGGNYDAVAGYLNNKNNKLNQNGNTSSAIYFMNGELKIEYAKYWNRYEVSREEKDNEIVIDATETLTQEELYNSSLNAEKYNAARLRLTTEIFNNMALCRGIGTNEITASFSYYGVNYNNKWAYYTNTTQPQNSTSSTYARGWKGDAITIGHNNAVFFTRGGLYSNTVVIGVFTSYLSLGTRRC